MDRAEEQRLLAHDAEPLPLAFNSELHKRKARGFIHCCFAARDAGIDSNELLGETMHYTHGALSPFYILEQIEAIRRIYAAIPRY